MGATQNTQNEVFGYSAKWTISFINRFWHKNAHINIKRGVTNDTKPCKLFKLL